MINSASNSASKTQSAPVLVNRANKLARDPLRRALVEALSRSAPLGRDTEVDDDGEE